MSNTVTAKENEKDLVLLGKINGDFGVNGWVKVFSYTQPRENITSYRQVLINCHGQSNKRNTADIEKWKLVEITQGRSQGKTVVVHIKGYDSREASAALIGCEIAVNKVDLPKLSKDDFYWRDLIGLEVINSQGVTLGKVSSMLPTGGNDVVIIKASQIIRAKYELEELLIPYVLKEFILNIDLDLGVMQVDWDVEFLF